MLSVDGLCKKYPSFELKNVSFKLEAGYIMGFVGRNEPVKRLRSSQ